MEEIKNNVYQFFEANHNFDIDEFQIEYLNQLNSFISIDDKIAFSKILIIKFQIKKKQLLSEKKVMVYENDKVQIRKKILQQKKKIYFIQNNINDLIKEKVNESNHKLKKRVKQEYIIQPVKRDKKPKIKKENNVTKKVFKTAHQDKTNISIPTKRGLDNNFRLPFSYLQIQNIDEKYDINTIDIIDELNNSDNKNDMIKKITYIYSYILNQLEIENNNRDIITIKYFLEKLNVYSKNNINNPKTKQTNELEFINQIDTNDIQIEIENEMQENREVLSYELDDVMAALAHLIKNSEITNDINTIKKYTNYVNSELCEYMYENNKIFLEFNYMLDILKNKMNTFDKDSEERIFLKDMLKKYQEVYKIYDGTKERKNNKNPYFDILNYWLKDEKNYLYIKELLKRKPEVNNIHINNQHIIIYLLDEYIDNFKKMIKDKNSDYINKNYLKEVYFLFTKNYNLRVTKEEKQIIAIKLKEFSLYIKTTLIKQKRKVAALEDIKTLQPINYYISSIKYEFNDYSIDLLSYEKQQIANNYMYTIKDKQLTPAFMVGNNAYNILKKRNCIILKMYSVDVHQYIPSRSIMNQYFEMCEFTKEPIDEFISKIFKFEESTKFPVICYNLEFYISGKIKSLDITKEIISISDKYNTMYVMDENLKQFYDLYKKSIIKNGGTSTQFDIYNMNNHFEDILNNEYVKFLNKYKLPFIYYGCSLPTDDEKIENMNSLTNIFYDLNKSDSREIINIFSSTIDEFHYSIVPIENPKYDLKLIDSFNYLGLTNQRMLGELYFNERKIEDPTRFYKLKNEYLRKYIQKINELNKSFDYVDRHEIKESKGKIKRKLGI